MKVNNFSDKSDLGLSKIGYSSKRGFLSSLLFLSPGSLLSAVHTPFPFQTGEKTPGQDVGHFIEGGKRPQVYGRERSLWGNDPGGTTDYVRCPRETESRVRGESRTETPSGCWRKTTPGSGPSVGSVRPVQKVFLSPVDRRYIWWSGCPLQFAKTTGERYVTGVPVEVGVPPESLLSFYERRHKCL